MAGPPWQSTGDGLENTGSTVPLALRKIRSHDETKPREQQSAAQILEVMHQAERSGRGVSILQTGKLTVGSRWSALLSKLCAVFNSALCIKQRQQVISILDRALSNDLQKAAGEDTVLAQRYRELSARMISDLEQSNRSGAWPQANQISLNIAAGLTEAMNEYHKWKCQANSDAKTADGLLAKPADPGRTVSDAKMLADELLAKLTGTERIHLTKQDRYQWNVTIDPKYKMQLKLKPTETPGGVGLRLEFEPAADLTFPGLDTNQLASLESQQKLVSGFNITANGGNAASATKIFVRCIDSTSWTIRLENSDPHLVLAPIRDDSTGKFSLECAPYHVRQEANKDLMAVLNQDSLNISFGAFDVPALRAVKVETHQQPALLSREKPSSVSEASPILSRG